MALKELLPGAKAPSTYPGNVHLEVPTYQAACAVLSEERMIYNPPLILQKNRSLKLVPKSVIRNPAIPPRAVRPRCASVRIIPTGHNGNTQLGNRQQTGDRMHGKRHSFKVAYPRPLDGISAMRRQSEVIPSDLACPVSRPFFFPKSNNPQPRSKTTQLERVNTEDSFSITSNTENAALSSSKNTHFRYQGSFTQTYAAGCTPWKRLASVLSKIHGSSKRPQRK
ncbi:hypothetical protein CPB83DRAFT_134112 [Crepidotus variabilis]|uniref:Uncharacterized protein n=1 Tax=Crepidotus variabilis TaxID=179855 RepID=A0A9P6E465_9AGAR|nr:hypothetical protein CPB83DRAFT_134112 [Crepidotus variabilis]